MSDLEYKNKYLKYKSKYLELKKELENSNLEGGGVLSDGYYVFFTNQLLSKVDGFVDSGNELNWINNLGIFYYIKIGKAKLGYDIFSTYNTIYMYNPNTQQSSPLRETKQSNSYIEDIDSSETLAIKIFDANKKLFQNKGCYLYTTLVKIEKNIIKVQTVYVVNRENKCTISGYPSPPEMSGKDI